ncbi:putative E3 ubiquitin-protein ligase [Fusarium irregulare]|uniref:HECT-type E3 ubiquitin transferase n=1 Tax=Fusarium irregulare TaxID=2494466 RepID=A0A9W8UFV8_9HYPO|nr:putative E3 ubiquitin-protein ligase [Fusarium irregulare]KAJ4025169.1 putative E3 ubiquitin-protein ligase [Fusarium irregulare]
MAPWLSRRGSQPNNSSNSNSDLITRIHNTALHTPTTLPALYSNNLQATTGNGNRFELSFSNTNADSSSDESDLHPSRPSSSKAQRPPHTRSMSQPFPSLFSSKKKRQNSVGAPPPDLGFADDDAVMPRQAPKTHVRNPSQNGNGPAGSKDFATGNCMTCGSLVRWPRELKVFKCTICTTVNDLEPLSADHDISKARRDANNGPSQASPPRIAHISIEQTKRLVHQSIQSYLNKRLHPIPKPPTEPPPEPPVQSKLSFSSRMQAAGRSLAPMDSRKDATPSKKSPTIQVSRYTFDEEPTLRANNVRTNSSPMPRSYSSSYTERPPVQKIIQDNAPREARKPSPDTPESDPKRIFKALEDYVVVCFGSFECINSSFSTHPRPAARHVSEATRRKPMSSDEPREQRGHRRAPSENHALREQRQARTAPPVEDSTFDLDPKMLLLGDFAENGTWWMGNQEESRPRRPSAHRTDRSFSNTPVSTKTPQMNWNDLMAFYTSAVNPAKGWFAVYEDLCRDQNFQTPPQRELQSIERELLQGQEHARRVLLKATEMLLKRPGRPLKDPADLRFLLIVLENPLLHENEPLFYGILQPENNSPSRANFSRPRKTSAPETGLLSGQHSGIIKRIVGLISNSSPECHNQLITWFARHHPSRFVRTKEIASGFLTYRMIRQSGKKQEVKVDITAGLIPQMQEGRSGAYLYDEINRSTSSKKAKEPEKKIMYGEDWQIRASSRVLALLFAANNLPHGRRNEEVPSAPSKPGDGRSGAHHHGQILPTTDFYNSMIDYTDLVADFENWESRKSKFTFCQYPFLLSIWAKNHILEHDARRQMQSKARDAFFDSIMSRKAINQFLELNVRRDCLVDDSLKAVSEVIGSGSEDVKKGLRITFSGEEGVDAGGLRKEWFLLLVREVFNPDHGLFLYDEDSQYCYFNPNSFETSDQFFLVGVVMGLAIYNSTILDVALPPFAFRKLIASAPTHGTGASAHPKPPMRYSLEDLAEYRPRLARGLRQLLEYEGNVEETFCLDFVIDTDKYGTQVQVPLCPGGERIPVTNSNRREYVDLYVRHVIDVSVTRQFEPFKRGFYTVCGGNALSLFRPEEIELLVRGSDEALDINSLRGVAEYNNWGNKSPDGSEPVIGWFWETFQEATSQDQRKLLLFITGSDRIPAMGAAVLPIKISCLGEDEGRFPIARTCFNMLSLSRYASKERLEQMLWTAVRESEGFGIK